MEPTTTNALLHDVEEVRQHARDDRRATSVPLLIFGGLAVIDALLRMMAGPFNFGLLLLAPIGFALVAGYYRRREIGTGVGQRPRSYTVAAVVTLVLAGPFLFLLGSAGVAGLGLLVIALHQRNQYLGFWAGVYGLVGGLEAIHFFSNRLFDANQALGLISGINGYFSWSSSLVYGLLGLALMAAGVHARRREVASA